MEVANDTQTSPTTPDVRSAAFDELRTLEADGSIEARLELQRRAGVWQVFIGGSVRLRDCTLETFKAESKQQHAVRDGAAGFADRVGTLKHDGIGALFYGRVGTGKDHLAVSILRIAIKEHGHTAVRINGPEWFGELRDRIDTDSPERAMVSRLTSPDWLLISDPLPPLGRLTEHQASWLYRIMDIRQASGRPTIVTCNVNDGTEGIDRLGAATWDRIRFRAWVFPCDWASHRQPARVIGREP